MITNKVKDKWRLNNENTLLFCNSLVYMWFPPCSLIFWAISKWQLKQRILTLSWITNHRIIYYYTKHQPTFFVHFDHEFSIGEAVENLLASSLAGVVQQTEFWPANQKVTGLIPDQDTCLGCRPGMREATDECLSSSLSPSLPLFLKISEIYKKKKKLLTSAIPYNPLTPF